VKLRCGTFCLVTEAQESEYEYGEASDAAILTFKFLTPFKAGDAYFMEDSGYYYGNKASNRTNELWQEEDAPLVFLLGSVDHRDKEFVDLDIVEIFESEDPNAKSVKFNEQKYSYKEGQENVRGHAEGW